MWVVGAMTATRATRPSCSIRWATCRPNVVLPAAGVADARNASPGWEKTAAAAACCHARRGRSAGQDGRVKRSGSFLGSGVLRHSGRRRLAGAPDGSAVGHGDVRDHALLLVALDVAPQLPGAGGSA